MGWRASGNDRVREHVFRGGADGALDEVVASTRNYFMQLGSRALWFSVRSDGSVVVTHSEDRAAGDEWPALPAVAGRPKRPKVIRKARRRAVRDRK